MAEMGVPIQCPSCHKTNTTANYEHQHPTGVHKWQKPASGATPYGQPYPDPCPTDGVSCRAASLYCNGESKITAVYSS